VQAHPALRCFDPEVVGFMLAHSPKDQAFSDFQDLRRGALCSRQEVIAYIAGVINVELGVRLGDWTVVDRKAHRCSATHRTPARIACRRVLQVTLSVPAITSIGP